MSLKIKKTIPEPVIPEEGVLYRDFKSDINNFSYWFPKIKDCGANVPESVVVPVPENVMKCFFMERENDERQVQAWVEEAVMPAVKGMKSLLFVKNGTFSGKFRFRSCTPMRSVSHLTASIIDINYDALCVDAGGNTEMVFRERVGWRDEWDCYKIYEGMPLRPEFRVFYDFDRKKVLYAVNYWNWDYCHEAISRDRTDKIAYEAAYPAINTFFVEHKQEVMEMAGKHMENVEGFSGAWSIDYMYADGKYWLIDMATARTSAYWNPGKAG